MIRLTGHWFRDAQLTIRSKLVAHSGIRSRLIRSPGQTSWPDQIGSSLAALKPSPAPWTSAPGWATASADGPCSALGLKPWPEPALHFTRLTQTAWLDDATMSLDLIDGPGASTGGSDAGSNAGPLKTINSFSKRLRDTPPLKRVRLREATCATDRRKHKVRYSKNHAQA